MLGDGQGSGEPWRFDPKQMDQTRNAMVLWAIDAKIASPLIRAMHPGANASIVWIEGLIG